MKSVQVNNNDIRLHFKHFSGVSIIDFEQINAAYTDKLNVFLVNSKGTTTISIDFILLYFFC